MEPTFDYLTAQIFDLQAELSRRGLSTLGTSRDELIARLRLADKNGIRPLSPKAKKQQTEEVKPLLLVDNKGKVTNLADRVHKLDRAKRFAERQPKPQTTTAPTPVPTPPTPATILDSDPLTKERMEARTKRFGHSLPGQGNIQTEEEKLQKRMARFATEPAPTEQDRIRKRAARFGVQNESAVKRRRIERFGKVSL